ncbi:MAG: hypothetical protein VKK63_10710 [Synechococcus sp.]|nr:hypothetical protein [Synechococcus sp.]
MELINMGAGQFGAANTGFNSGLNSGFGTSLHDFHAEPDQAIDSLDVYFECITTCSLDDGACMTRCVELLREAA